MQEMVRAAAGLQNHLGSRLLLEERLDLVALQLAPQRRVLSLVDAMEGEDMLGRYRWRCA
ncbi:MAG: hypothetical protein M3Y41_11910 [Pseudomonadota bacterium]|nr:hypothetical protein [Pseudomonadota bacterium]